MAIKNKQEKARFGLVGIANTALDFVILFVLTAAGLPTLVANFISTTTAFLFSFAANRSFTFKAADGNKTRQFILFLVITLAGLWILQPVVIGVSEPLFISFGFAAWVSLLSAKLLATIVSLVWNYVLYSRLVFAKT